MAKLSDDEIINFMKDMLNYTVKREQLASPTRQLVIEIYAQFLQELDFDINSITQRDFMACGDMTNIEAMDGILVPIHIFTIVQQCVVHYGILDMNLMDILSPKRSRTNKIISALCFFFLRYTAVKKEWLRLKNEGLAIRTEILQLKQKDQELKHLIEEKSMLFTSLNNNSEAMEKEKNALIEENKKKKRESDEKSEQFKLTKTEILKLEDRLCNINIDISKGKEEIKQLEGLIIKSPQKSIQITADMERALMELKKEVPEKKQQLMTINKMIDCYKAVLTYLKPSTGDISNLLIMLSSTDKECENLENIKQDTLSLKEEIKSIKIKMNECQKAKQGWQTKINNWARQHQRILGQLEELNSGLQESKKTKSEEIAKLQNQKQWVEKALKQLQSTHDSLDKDFKEIEKRYTETITKYKEELVKRY